MDCKDVDGYIDRQWQDGGTVMPVEVARHLGSCTSCRKLLKWCNEPHVAPSVSRSLLEGIRRHLSYRLEPVEPASAPYSQAMKLMGIFLAVTVAGLLWLGAELPQALWRQPELAGLILIASVILSTMIGQVATPGSRQPVTPSKLMGVVLGVLPLGIVVVFPWNTAAATLVAGHQCLTNGILIAAPAAFLFAVVGRGGLLLSRPLFWGLIALMAGLTGYLVVGLSCPVLEAGHRLLWHLSIPVAAMAAGLLVGREVSSRRS